MLGYDRFLGRYRVATVPWIPFRKYGLSDEIIRKLEKREDATADLRTVLGLADQRQKMSL
jgi:hypothetical protein